MESELPGQRAGRPMKFGVAGEIATIAVRLPSAPKTALVTAARENASSLSLEGARRIGLSFEKQALLPDVLSLAYGRQPAALFMMLMRAASNAGRRAALAATGDVDAMERWCDVGPAYDQAVRACLAVFKANRPEGDRTFPEPAHTALRPGGPPEYIGADAAIAILAAVKDPDAVNPPDMPESAKNYLREAEGREINRLLGPVGCDRITVPDMREAHVTIRAELDERRARLRAEAEASVKPAGAGAD
jgi:hypothetical protein